MKKEITKIKELEYNELTTIGLIESDEDLSTIFMEEVKMTFNMVRTFAKANKLSPETKALIKDLFDKVILTKDTLINRYQLMSIQPTTEVPEEKPVKPVKPVKPKKVKELPRRYGKDSIQKDIAKQDGKATSVQLAALELNDLRNIYVKLNARLINDMLTDKPILSVEDYREIRSAISILKNKLKNILKKK